MGKLAGCWHSAGPSFRFPAHQWERDSPTSCERQQTQSATPFLWCAFKLLIKDFGLKIVPNLWAMRFASNACSVVLYPHVAQNASSKKLAARLSCNAIRVYCWRLGLTGRDLLIFLTVANWAPIVAMELVFGLIIGVGFVLHTFGFASSGVIFACVGGVGSATAFIMLIGWSTAFYLWYVSLAVLLLAVPIGNWIKWLIAICFIGVYSLAYLFLSESQPVFEIPALTRDVLAISCIIGALLILGLPMGLYSKFLVEERDRSERLLHNIMPKDIADRLKGERKSIALENPDVSVLMADIVNFTAFSEKVSADEVVALLDVMFSEFDDVVDEFGVEKIKTIGDSYMIVAGVPQHRKDHATVLYRVSSELHRVANEFKDNQGNSIRLRIGIYSGPAVSGVIGKSKFAFDVWGDTINTGACLEAYGEPGKVHLSEKIYLLIKDDFGLNLAPSEVIMKGKGRVTTDLA